VQAFAKEEVQLEQEEEQALYEYYFKIPVQTP
jgi:hypothetical protein